MVVLCNDTMNFAGTEKYLADLAIALRALGEQVQVACPSSSLLARKLSVAKVPVIDADFRGVGVFATLVKLVGILRNRECSILHVHNGRCSAVAALARWIAGSGHIVATQHFIQPANLSRSGIVGRISREIHRRIRGQISHVIAISNAVREAAIARNECDESSITLIHNGISQPPESHTDPVRKSLKISDDQVLFVCAARLEKEKNVDILLKAHGQIYEAGVKAITVVAGEGDERGSLAMAAAAPELSNSFHLLGFRKDIFDLIAAADVFVLPAALEPFGLVLLEAMALGRPVIAINAGGPREIVIHGVTGLLVPPRDPDAFANAMCELARNPTLRTKMGIAGKERFENCFTAQRMATKTAEIYRKVTCQNGTRSKPEPHAEFAFS